MDDEFLRENRWSKWVSLYWLAAPFLSIGWHSHPWKRTNQLDSTITHWLKAIMGREKDRFWEYVEDLSGHLYCKFCEHKFSGGITRIKSHLSGLRGRNIEVRPKVPEDVQLAALEAIGAPMKETRSLKSLNNVGEAEVISTSASNKKAKRLRQPICLEKEFGPIYEFPNALALATELLPDIYFEAEEHVRNLKKLSTTTGCSLVMFNVVKNSKLVCINIFAHTPVGMVYIRKIAVPEEGMKFDNFVDGLYYTIELGGQRMLFIQDLISRKYPWIYLNRCAGREFGLFLVLTYLAVPWIHKTTQLAKVIFKYLYKHDINLTPRKEHARNKEYGFAGLTKIAAEFYTLNSILDVEKELQALQLPIASESCEGPSREDDVGKIVDKAIHSTEFWSRGKEVVRVLRPLFQVLDFIDGNGATSGYLYDAMKRAEEAIEQQCDADDQIHYETIRKMFTKWRSRVVHPINAAAVLLNPAYFCSEKFTEDAEMQKGLELLTLLNPPEEQEAFLKQVQFYRLKVSDLFSATAMKMLNTIHPRKWWECFGDHCPILRKLAVWIRSIH
ncbi:hypothetical protein ACOSQ2_003674 [Xanthoceras sorbifolium]